MITITSAIILFAGFLLLWEILFLYLKGKFDMTWGEAKCASLMALGGLTLIIAGVISADICLYRDYGINWLYFAIGCEVIVPIFIYINYLVFGKK